MILIWYFIEIVLFKGALEAFGQNWVLIFVLGFLLALVLAVFRRNDG